MLMVVESDGVHMKELPYIAQDISVRADQDESETIYIPGLRYNNNNIFNTSIRIYFIFYIIIYDPTV